MADTTTFAVIGDYGDGSAQQVAVADLLKSWNPDFIATTGDNSYISDYSSTVGLTYSEFLDAGRFFPAIGNHDWIYPESYFEFFELPGNEIYYDVVVGDVHLFMYDNNFGWGSPIGPAEQDAWLQDAVSKSTAKWKFLLAHQPREADSSRSNYVPDHIILDGGIDAFFAGHNHYYQRSRITATTPSFIVGNSGRSLYRDYPGPNLPDVFYNEDYGALKVRLDDKRVTYEFWSIADGGTLIDTYTVIKPDVCDFNRDGVLDTDDIDELTAQSASGQNDPLYDLNGDGVVDGQDVLAWASDCYKTYLGDTNLDRAFTSEDLIQVAAALTYEQEVDAVWTTGDWNGDGRFSSQDLIESAASACYECGPYLEATVAAVPEPAAAGLMMVGIAISLRRLRYRRGL